MLGAIVTATDTKIEQAEAKLKIALRRGNHKAISAAEQALADAKATAVRAADRAATRDRLVKENATEAQVAETERRTVNADKLVAAIPAPEVVFVYRGKRIAITVAGENRLAGVEGVRRLAYFIARDHGDYVFETRTRTIAGQPLSDRDPLWLDRLMSSEAGGLHYADKAGLVTVTDEPKGKS